MSGRGDRSQGGKAESGDDQDCLEHSVLPNFGADWIAAADQGSLSRACISDMSWPGCFVSPVSLLYRGHRMAEMPGARVTSGRCNRPGVELSGRLEHLAGPLSGGPSNRD